MIIKKHEFHNIYNLTNNAVSEKLESFFTENNIEQAEITSYNFPIIATSDNHCLIINEHKVSVIQDL